MQSAWDDQVPAGFSGLAEEIRPAPHCCPERGRSQRPSRLPAAKAPGLIAIPAKGSKASRAHAKTPLVEAGQVRFARKTDSLIEEMLAFSLRGGVDDQVDAFCQEVPWIEARLWRGRGYGSSPVPMVFSRWAMTHAIARPLRKPIAAARQATSLRTDHPKEDLEQIAMVGIILAALRFSPKRGSFQPYARRYANG